MPHARPATAAPNSAALNEAEALYLPTPQHVVDAMLRMAKLGRGDVLYDLGSGDGRIPVTAARRFPLMTFEWPEEDAKIEGKERVKLEGSMDSLAAPDQALREKTSNILTGG